MLDLLAACDAVLSLHRAEGFGFLLAEGMALGKPVLATGYSSNVDFMTADNSLLVDHRLVALDRDVGPYRRGARWAEPDLAHAAELMRGLVADPERARRIGERARRDVTESLSPARVGALLRGHLERLHAAGPPRRSRLEALLRELRLTSDPTVAPRGAAAGEGRVVGAVRRLANRILGPVLARQQRHDELLIEAVEALARRVEALETRDRPE
jgi:hypothetical protein